MRKEQNALVMLVGIPGSGKSTWISKTFENNWPVVSSDNFIEQKAKENDASYDQMFQKHIKEAEAFVTAQVKAYTEKNLSFVWDQTNLTKKVRARKLSQIPGDYFKMAVFFDISKQTILERLVKRSAEQGKTIPTNIINSMFGNMCAPTLEEGFNSILIIKEDGNNILLGSEIPYV